MGNDLKNICPCCNKEIGIDEEIYVDGGDISTGRIITTLHKACADKIINQEEENGLRN